MRVRVANPAPGPGDPAAGLGLPGMSERARSLGGTLDAGHDGARFWVDAWLPAGTERS